MHTECPSSLFENEYTFSVFLTVNSIISLSLFGKQKTRQIELNWSLPPDARSTDWVGLFRRDPEKGLTRKSFDIQVPVFCSLVLVILTASSSSSSYAARSSNTVKCQ